MLISICFVFATINQNTQDFRKWGNETLDSIQRDLRLPDTGLYLEEVRPNEAGKTVAFNWGVGVMIQALNAGAKLDPSLRPRLINYLEATRTYWNPAGPVPGYDVHPMPKPVDRYYDDNEWMVLALAESADILKSKEVLTWAKETFDYVMSGKDSKLGGGIYWHETEKNSKNTCSNAPAAAAALALYDATKKRAYVQTAEEIYAWTKSHLRDPADGLYWDNIGINGHIEKAKWSYNTGLMLRSAAELYRITKKEEYASDTREIQIASLKRWVDPNGSLKDDGKFVHLLLENWLRAFREVPGTADPRQAINTGLKRLYELSRDTLGHFGNRWDQTPNSSPYSPYKLIDQASAARAFLEASVQ